MIAARILLCTLLISNYAYSAQNAPRDIKSMSLNTDKIKLAEKKIF